MHGNGQHHTNGPAAPAARPGRRLAQAKVAANDLRIDAGTWLHLRGARLGNRLRRAAWRLLTWALLAFVLLVTVATAVVMLLVGAAGSLAEQLGTSPATGMMAVAVAACLSLFALLVLGRRGTPRGEFDAAEARLRTSMGNSVRRLGRTVWSLPGLLLVVGLGFASVRAVRDRRLRRLLLLGLGTLRSAHRLLAADGGPLRPRAGKMAGRAAG